jgi:hypothetical protein
MKGWTGPADELVAEARKIAERGIRQQDVIKALV